MYTKVPDRVVQFKDLSFKLKDMDDEGKFQGIGAVNENVDSGRDRFRGPGQWTKTIKERGGDPFPLYVGHDSRKTVGSFYPKDVREGLFMDGRLNLSMIKNTQVPAVPLAHEIRALYMVQEDGKADMKGLSVGFIPVRVKWETIKVGDEDITIRDIYESSLIEVSFTGNPMNSLAMVSDMKSGFDILDYVASNIKDKDIRYKWISLRYPGMAPEWIESTLDAAFKAAQAPDNPSTPPAVEEPKTFSQILAKKLGGN